MGECADIGLISPFSNSESFQSISREQLSIRNQLGRTPLHQAVINNNLLLVTLFLSRGADVNVKDCEGMTPLHYSALCTGQNKRIAALLIEHGTNVLIRDHANQTPLGVAVYKENKEFLEIYEECLFRFTSKLAKQIRTESIRGGR